MLELIMKTRVGQRLRLQRRYQIQCHQNALFQFHQILRQQEEEFVEEKAI